MQPGTVDPQRALREALRHVRWIGGAPGGGKTAVTQGLAARHRVRSYDTDVAIATHVPRLTPEAAP